MSNESSSFILNPQCDAADIAGVREILTTTEKGKPANTKKIGFVKKNV